jgi:hypothetical protein
MFLKFGKTSGFCRRSWYGQSGNLRKIVDLKKLGRQQIIIWVNDLLGLLSMEWKF